jgi:predicted dehydrogenase
VTEPLRLAIAGCGAIAQLAHLPVLAKMRGVRLVALCDNDAAKARALAERFEVPDVFDDLEELLDSDAIDGLVVATPNHLHEPHVLSAIRAGVDVLCERPLALTSRGVERVLAAAAKANRRVIVGNNHRFRNDVQALSRFVSTGSWDAWSACAPVPTRRARRKAGGSGGRRRAVARSWSRASTCSTCPSGSRTSPIRCACGRT